MVSFIKFFKIIFFYYIFIFFLGTKCRESYVSMSKRKHFFQQNFIKYIFFLYLFKYISFNRTTLARWRAAQSNEGARKEQERRPYLASECRDLRKAEKWRMQIIREIAKKVAQIQNAGLGEFRIRDLNDEINKLLREKRHWEAQIKELGGPDYSRVGPRMLDHEGREVQYIFI